MGEFKTFTYEGEIKISTAEEARFHEAVKNLLRQDEKARAELALYSSQVLENSWPTIYTYLLARQQTAANKSFKPVLIYDEATQRLLLRQKPTVAERRLQAGMKRLIISDYDPWPTLNAGQALVLTQRAYAQNKNSSFAWGMDAIYGRLDSFKKGQISRGYYIFGAGKNPARLLDLTVAVATLTIKKNTALVGPDGVLLKLQRPGEEQTLRRLQQVPVLIIKDFATLPKNLRFIETALLPLLKARATDKTITFITSTVDILSASKILGYPLSTAASLYEAIGALTEALEINDFVI